MTNQMKAIEQYFHVVLFIILYKVVLTFKSMDKTPVSWYSMEATEQYVHFAMLIILYKVVVI